MTNYKLTYVFDGCRFYDVVNAENLEKAFAYLKWISEEPAFSLLSQESGETNEAATYYCPMGWTEPETVEQAKRRSLLTALCEAGIKDVYTYSPELDQTMNEMGYTATREERKSVFALFDEVVIVYKRSGCASLIVKAV